MILSFIVSFVDLNDDRFHSVRLLLVRDRANADKFLYFFAHRTNKGLFKRQKSNSINERVNEHRLSIREWLLDSNFRMDKYYYLFVIFSSLAITFFSFLFFLFRLHNDINIQITFSSFCAYFYLALRAENH